LIFQDAIFSKESARKQFVIKLSKSDESAINAHGERDYPYECCSLLIGRFLEDGPKEIIETYPILSFDESQAVRPKKQKSCLTGASGHHPIKCPHLQRNELCRWSVIPCKPLILQNLEARLAQQFGTHS